MKVIALTFCCRLTNTEKVSVCDCKNLQFLNTRNARNFQANDLLIFYYSPEY